MKVNVLITGVGGCLGQFILKALKHSNIQHKAVGCDCDSNSLGLFQTDKAYLVPTAFSPDYLNKITEICTNEEIDIIMAGSMVELRLLSQFKDQIKEKTNAFVVSSDIDTLQLMEDKWNLVEFLKQAGFDFPNSILALQTDEIKDFVDTYGFPLIVKDRLGSGSKGLGIAKNEQQLHQLIKQIPNAIIQEYLLPDDEEYTVGVFVGSNGKASGNIVMKRELGLGMTFKAEVFPDSKIGAHCERVLEKIGCIGR
jgi:carbamoyl-phosphate synthase large subunit